MWDELNKDEVSKIVKANLGNKTNLADSLLNTSLKKAAQSSKMPESELRSMPLGQRRSYHDDMTIIVVDLDGQYKS